MSLCGWLDIVGMILQQCAVLKAWFFFESTLMRGVAACHCSLECDQTIASNEKDLHFYNILQNKIPFKLPK